MRFFEQNQPRCKSHAAGQQMRERMIELARRALPSRRRRPTAQLRAALAIFALHTSWFAVRDPDITDDDAAARAGGRAATLGSAETASELSSRRQPAAVSQPQAEQVHARQRRPVQLRHRTKPSRS